MTVHVCRILEYRLDHVPAALFQPAVKTGFAPGVAGHADLIDEQEHGVAGQDVAADELRTACIPLLGELCAAGVLVVPSDC